MDRAGGYLRKTGSELNAITKTVTSYLTALGFVKKGGAWYFTNSQTITVVTLTKFQYGDLYFFDVFAWFREVEDIAFPPPRSCHVRLRIDENLPANDKLFAEYLSLERSVPDDQRSELIVEKLNEHFAPLLGIFASVAKLKEQWAKGEYVGYWFDRDAQLIFLGME